MKLLLTGFLPFHSEPVNPSQKLVESLSGLRWPEHVEISPLILPVSYQRSWEMLERELTRKQYDALLMLGQAGGRTKICLERVATNLMDSESMDEDGIKYLETKISETGPDAFMTDLPLRLWLEKLNSSCASKADISHSAGGFGCNSLYYRTHLWKHDVGANLNLLFVHVPYLPTQVFGKSEHTPFMTMDAMEECILTLIKLMMGQSSVQG